MQRGSDAGSVLGARDRGCPRVLHRPIRVAGALRNGRCGKSCSSRARQVKRGARRPALRRCREPGVMQSLLLCGAASLKALIAGHFEGCSLRIKVRALSEAISASVALKRPERSFGAMTDSSALSMTSSLDGNRRPEGRHYYAESLDLQCGHIPMNKLRYLSSYDPPLCITIRSALHPLCAAVHNGW